MGKDLPHLLHLEKFTKDSSFISVPKESPTSLIIQGLLLEHTEPGPGQPLVQGCYMLVQCVQPHLEISCSQLEKNKDIRRGLFSLQQQSAN